jgi:hypothetical protein
VADFVDIIRRAVEGLTENSLDMRVKVYDRARGAVHRQMQVMRPPPPKAMLQRQFEKLEGAIREVEAEYSPLTSEADVIKAYEALQNDAIEKPRVPAQQPGLFFGLNEKTGRVAIVPASTASDEDLSEIGGLREVLSEAVDDLLQLTAGSNTFRQINVIAERYGRALHGDNDRLYVDVLYAQGLRLQIEAENCRPRIASSDPHDELAYSVARAADSVIAIHGPTVMSTSLGRELSNRSRQYTLIPEVEEVYRDTAIDLLNALRRNAPVVDDSDVEQVIQLTEDINRGPEARRSTLLARSTHANLMVQLAKIVVAGGSGIVISKAFEDTQFASDSAQSLTKVFNQTWAFFVLNREQIIDFAKLAGSDLSWMNSLLRWMESTNRGNT